MSAPYRPVNLDDSQPLLGMSYRLRYQAFCLEQLFFKKDDYPTQLESDAFDRASLHVGVLDARNDLVGTARIVPRTAAGLPLLRYCTFFPEYDTTLSAPANIVVELSRVCLNRRWDRRTASRPIPHPDRRASVRLPPWPPERGHGSNDPFVALITAVYQTTKRMAVTHWVVAVEKGLRRRLTRYGLPFHLAGPEVDYFGPVAPYLLNVSEFDEVILSRRFPSLDEVLVGLEPEYLPAPARHAAR